MSVYSCAHAAGTYLAKRGIHLAEIPWNHELSRNFQAKSCARVSYKQNPDFKELSELVAMIQLVPVMGAAPQS